jgi:S-adenosylmethionine synthetase
VKDIGHEQRGFHWEKASIRVYLHGQSVDIAQGVVPAPIYTHHIPKAMSEVWHANPNGKFVIGELRYSWRGGITVGGGASQLPRRLKDTFSRWIRPAACALSHDR